MLCCLMCDCAEEHRGAAQSAIATAASSAAASKRSPKGSPCSCLACSDGIPGSVPSDYRLAPLPPISHTCIQINPPAPSIAAPSSSSPQCVAARYLHVHSNTGDCDNSPHTHTRLSFLSVATRFSTNFTPASIRLVSPEVDCFCFCFFSLVSPFVNRASVWF